MSEPINVTSDMNVGQENGIEYIKEDIREDIQEDKRMSDNINDIENTETNNILNVVDNKNTETVDYEDIRNSIKLEVKHRDNLIRLKDQSLYKLFNKLDIHILTLSHLDTYYQVKLISDIYHAEVFTVDSFKFVFGYILTLQDKIVRLLDSPTDSTNGLIACKNLLMLYLIMLCKPVPIQYKILFLLNIYSTCTDITGSIIINDEILEKKLLISVQNISGVSVSIHEGFPIRIMIDELKINLQFIHYFYFKTSDKLSNVSILPTLKKLPIIPAKYISIYINNKHDIKDLKLDVNVYDNDNDHYMLIINRLILNQQMIQDFLANTNKRKIVVVNVDEMKIESTDDNNNKSNEDIEKNKINKDNKNDDKEDKEDKKDKEDKEDKEDDENDDENDDMVKDISELHKDNEDSEEDEEDEEDEDEDENKEAEDNNNIENIRDILMNVEDNQDDNIHDSTLINIIKNIVNVIYPPITSKNIDDIIQDLKLLAGNTKYSHVNYCIKTLEVINNNNDTIISFGKTHYVKDAVLLIYERVDIQIFIDTIFSCINYIYICLEDNLKLMMFNVLNMSNQKNKESIENEILSILEQSECINIQVELCCIVGQFIKIISSLDGCKVKMIDGRYIELEPLLSKDILSKEISMFLSTLVNEYESLDELYENALPMIKDKYKHVDESILTNIINSFKI
jgi:hypothetical protein